MPVNHSHKIVFIHIPKTGGTSVEYALGMHGDKNNIGLDIVTCITDDYNTLFGAGKQHLTAREIEQHMGAQKFQTFHKLSIVRNPYERLVSYVAWLNGKWQRQEMLTRAEFRNYVWKHFITRKLPMPQWYYLTIRKKNITDTLLRYEDLEAQYTCFAQQMGINTQLEHRMKSCHREYSYYYGALERKITNIYYKCDFMHFNYPYLT